MTTEPQQLLLELGPGPLDYPDDVRELAASSYARNTRIAYSGDWKLWIDWAKRRGVSALPARGGDLAAYYAEAAREGYAAQTIARWNAAISTAHKIAGHRSPAGSAIVRQVLRGIRRTSTATAIHADPIGLQRLIELLQWIDRNAPHPARRARDRAAFSLGYCGALRRGELAALQWSDLELSGRGMIVTLRRSKTDQEAEGAALAVPRARGPWCPVRELETWRAALDRIGGDVGAGKVIKNISPSGRLLPGRHWSLAIEQLEKILRRAAPELWGEGRWTLHSLRAGMITDGASRGLDPALLRRHSRHRSIATFERYVRIGDVWRASPLRGIYAATDTDEPAELPAKMRAALTAAEAAYRPVHGQPTTGSRDRDPPAVGLATGRSWDVWESRPAWW